MTEWEFTADAASWVNELLAKDPRLPFSRAKCEQRGKGSTKRRDLTLLDKNERVVLTGEVKLPFRREGSTPYSAALIEDARRKARRAKSPFFFTWNVNEFILWETTGARISWKEKNYQAWNVTRVHKEEHLDLPMTAHAIRDWLGRFIDEFAQILRGAAAIGIKSPDEKFIDALESALRLPIQGNFEELIARYEKPRFKGELDRWMREEQGWTIRDDIEGMKENLENAAKAACYALVNKLVFYEALLKRFRSQMDRLTIPEHIESADDLRKYIEAYFADAKKKTKDYETVFGEDHRIIGNRIPFYSDIAVPFWRELINRINEFDFSKLDYEIIGRIFERLIAPEKRRKYGQFYTRVEVVDLINSFCISTGEEKVMDPACGGGTFLVRAYARKRELDPTRKHRELLTDLFGVDKETFAAHLTTINLATIDLIDEENYPQITRNDFFNILSDKTFLILPRRIETKGLGAIQHRDVEIPPLDAVVGNPPYIRQENIPTGKKNGEPGSKEYYQRLVRRESGADLSGRSDIHCYFWPHAASFLKDDGYLCFLTSSQWLDVEYGFRLQEWILRNFEIISIIESIDEPWFVGARVATTVTILRRQRDEAKRMENIVRFIQLRRPIAEILAHDGTTAGAVSAADQFRDEILALPQNTVNNRFRARLRAQDDLWKEGVELGLAMGKANTKGDNEPAKNTGSYYGGKWGVYLRAPDIWFRLLDDHGSRFVPLGKIAEIRRGITSGKDSFFFPIDCSLECLETYLDAAEFELTYGVPRKLVKSGKVRLVRCGKGRTEIMPIEAKYLEPEVHSLMEINGFTVAPEDCGRMILLIGKKRSKIKDRYVLEYIEWGENKNYHKGSTCSARVSEKREWYDLTGHKHGALFWPMAQQYKHAIPLNVHNLICNHNLFDLSPRDQEPDVLAAVLNSTLVVLSKYQFGRPVGVEGNLKTEVIDVNMMLVPDSSIALAKAKHRATSAFAELKRRKALQFLSERRLRAMAYTQAGRERELDTLSDKCELDMPDRRELDDAVFEMLGVKGKRRRQELIDELYDYLRGFFEWTRQKEEKAIKNKMLAKRRGRAKPNDIAEQILQDITQNEPGLLRQYDPDFLDKSEPFDTFELPIDGTATVHTDMFMGHGVAFTKGKKRVALIETKKPAQDALVSLVANSGVRGFVRIPRTDEECNRVMREYETFINQRTSHLLKLIQDRTSDEDMQEKILDALLHLLMQNRV